MSGTSSAIDRLIGALGRLPGVGAKTAERLAHHLLKCSAEEALAARRSWLEEAEHTLAEFSG